MQSSQSVYNNMEPPDEASGSDRRARKSISKLVLSDGLGNTSQRPIDFNPFAPLTNPDQATIDVSDQTNENQHQKMMQKRAAKFGSRSNLDELQNENTLSTSGGGTQQPSPNANRSSSLRQDHVVQEKEEFDLKQTGGWGGEQLHQELYSDESEDDLLKNSEEFYENDDPHYASKVAAGEVQRRATADFAFGAVKELREKEISNKVTQEEGNLIAADVYRDEQRPSLPIKAKPLVLVQPDQLNSRTLGKEQLGQMQIGYSPLVSASQKTVNSVIKIPSYRQQTSEPYNKSVSHNSDTPTRQNSYQFGESKSFLERMGELKTSTQQSNQQRSDDPMQHTFANLNQPYQPTSAQVKPSQPFLTPLVESDMTSEKSAVNPFSIANPNSEAQSEEMVTAEGFFKNPTQTAKQLKTVSKAKNRTSVPLEQNSQQKSVSSAQVVSRKSEPVGPYSNMPAKNLKPLPLPSQKQPISSNVSNNSSNGIFKLKRSQIEVSQVSNDHFLPDEPYRRGFFDQSQTLPPTANFIQESIWVDQFGKTPFDQTLKPAINPGLGIRKYPTQDQTPLSHRHTYSLHDDPAIKNLQSNADRLGRPMETQNGLTLFSQQQERRRVGKFDRLIEQTEISLQQMPQQSETRFLNSSQDKVQSSFRDVFSQSKHYRNASEQKLQSAETRISGFDIELSQTGGIHGFQKNNLEGGHAFKTAAKLGLMSQENPFGVSGVQNSAKIPFPSIFQENSRLSNQGLGQSGNLPFEFEHLQQSERGLREAGQIDRFRDPPSVTIFPNETNNHSQLMYRKISSQGLMMPQANFNNLEQFGLNSAGRLDLGPYNAPVDHFPGPFAAPQTPTVKLQESQFGLNAHVYGGSRDRNRNRDFLGHSNHPDFNQLQKMNSFTQGSNTNSIPANTRPNVSKNMPLCFRENPSQRQRRGQPVNDTREITNYNNLPVSSNSPVKVQEPHNQSHQHSNQKSRSFSNDARNILQNNKLNAMAQGQTRASDPVAGHQTRVFSGLIPLKESSNWQ